MHSISYHNALNYIQSECKIYSRVLQVYQNWSDVSHMLDVGQPSLFYFFQ